MTDLHLHTSLSHDSTESVQNYIEAAIRAGADSLGFAEHYDYDAYLENGGKGCPLPDLDEYSKKLAELSNEFPQIKILKGIELGYTNAAEQHYTELLKTQNFDYAILSVHTLKDRGDCYFPAFFKGLSKKQAYGDYFNAVLQSVRSHINYSIIAHLGYVERYAPYGEKRIIYREFSDILDEILNEIIARGKCLEINTSAKGTQDICIPNPEIINRYIELGGKNFTLGSDAHTAQRFMHNFPAVKDLLLKSGINYTCRFEKGILFKENL